MNILKRLLGRGGPEGETSRTPTPLPEPTPASAVQTEPGKELVFDPADEGFVQDPYPLLAQLRQSEPVHRNPRGLWVITRYADVSGLLYDKRLGNSPAPYSVVAERNRHKYVCADVANNILPFQDPPVHTLPRKLVGKAFLDQLRRQPPRIEGIAHALLDRVSDQGSMDILEDFATPLSIKVLARFLGVPEEDEPRLKTWSEWFFYLFMPIPSQEVRSELDRNLQEFRQYFSDLLELRRRQPQPDLISALMNAELEGRRLSDAQLIDSCMLLFADGVENVDKLIASAVALLIQNPEQLKLLCDRPELLPSAVDECLRIETPAQFIGRVAQEDIELHGQLIKKHSGVLLVLGSANRDPETFTRADSFMINRKPNPYISFGKGRHACIGGSLVRLEVEEALRSLLARVDRLTLLEDKLVWTSRMGHRWLQRLPVSFDAIH